MVGPRPIPGAHPPAARARNGRDLTQGGIPWTLFIFSLPIVAQMSIQPLFGIIDRIFIAQLGTEAFTAVTNAGIFHMLVIMLAAGLSNGVASYVARLRVQEKKNRQTLTAIISGRERAWFISKL